MKHILLKQKKKHIAWLFALLFLNLSITHAQNSKLSDDFEVMDDAFSFLVIGDWGRKGDFNQQSVGDMMNTVAEKLDAEFVISTGDNFYPDGVASVEDPNWYFSFENVYKGFSLNVTWNVVLGNHDYRGNPQAQIDYTKRSKRWNMPDRYFVQDVDLENDQKASFIFLDTSPFEDKYYSHYKYAKVIALQDSTRQLIWLDSVLTAKKHLDWVVVTGHHPLYSGGKRLTETGDIRSHLEPILKKHKVDVYFAGHEHDLQHIKPPYNTHHFISGAGSEIRPTGEMEFTKFAASKPGFMAVSITNKKMIVQMVDNKGAVIYKTEIPKKQP